MLKPNTAKAILVGIAILGIAAGIYIKTKTAERSGSDAQLSTTPTSLSTESPAVVQGTSEVGTNVKPDASAKIEVLKEIFASKNDNDPRLDTEFKNLSEETKEKLKLEYSKLPKESRNERGTIVFLLGREVRSAGELSFFRNVLNETPCLSMSNCEKFGPVAVGEAAHLETLAQTTLAYPELMAVKMQERVYRSSDDPTIKETAVLIIKEATKSPIRSVSQEAHSILERIKAK